MEASIGSGAIVDGHVHLHRCFDIADALDSAARNFHRARSTLDLPGSAPAFLWLVEHDDEGASDRLKEELESRERWKQIRSDVSSIRIRRCLDDEDLTVILGQQIRTSEDLEILAVGGGTHLPPGLTLRDSIEASLAPDTLVMIPWGFGKWTGSRGRLVMEVYEEYLDRGLRLADTSAHSRFRPALPAFRRAVVDETPILAGGDPFPFPGQQGCIGRTGFLIENIPSEATWPDLLKAIRSLRGQPRRFGPHRGLLEFVYLQGRMQLRKRLGGRNRGS